MQRGSPALNASLKRKARRQKWLPLLLRFLAELRIQSKEVQSFDDDRGGAPLDLWDSQKMFLETLCDGLEDGVHEYYFLKSRQLGITTIGLAIILYWLAVHPGMIGCIVADDDRNSAGFREQLTKIMESFPEEFVGEDFVIVGNNKNFLSFSNGSRLDFLVAGKHKTAWAESKGYALAWVSEVSKYGKQEGIDSFRETLAQTNPDRLFIFESTANGFANVWHDMWIAAGDDPYTKRRRFIGWWAKPANMIPKKDPRFRIYGSESAPGGDEHKLIKQVEEQYGHVITLEQLAWYRWRQADKSAAEGTLEQNQPFTEQQAFIQPGFSFFRMGQIEKYYNAIVDADPPIAFKGYHFILGTKIFETRMEQIRDAEQLDLVDLRVWEEPRPDAVYAIGCDPAYGRSEWKDRHGISVWRCFADKMVQVAEYATAEVETHHCAWVLAYLAGAYRNCVLNLELTGPGRAVLRELENCREMINSELYARRTRELEWDDFLGQARWYLYHRYDSFGGGVAKGFECLALDTPLPTPRGWTTMGEVREGDLLLSDTGLPTKVIGVSDVKTEARCYRIVFDDGTTIVADENHWWKVARRNWANKGDKLRQTRELKPEKFYIRLAAPLDLPAASLPVDPYLLGVWLGDGSSDSAIVTCGDQDVEEMVANIEACGQPTRRTRHKTAWQVRLTNGNNGSRGNPLLRALRDLGVLKNKHIPAMYLRASRDQRLYLLQGLLDTDGSAIVTPPGKCNFVTTKPALAAGFSELIRSLGFKAKFLIFDESKAKGTPCALRYQFWFTAYPEMPVFRLQRKLDRIERREGQTYRPSCHRILSITEIASVPVRCVMVDGPTKMFLAGEGMIPTHNTTWRSKIEIMNQLRDTFMADMLVVRSLPLLEEMSTIIQTREDIGPQAPGRHKDDRVFALALSNRAWIDQLRSSLMQEGASYESVIAHEIGEMTATQQLIKRVVYDFFRTAEEREANPHVPSWLQDQGLI